MYDYQATGEDEINVQEGRTIQLTTGPRGGQNYGDGWWEGQCFPCTFTAFWRASSRCGRFNFRIIPPHLWFPRSVGHSCAGEARKIFSSAMAGRRSHVLPLSEPPTPRSPSSSARLSRNILRARFDAFILYLFGHDSQTSSVLKTSVSHIPGHLHPVQASMRGGRKAFSLAITCVQQSPTGYIRVIRIG